MNKNLKDYYINSGGAKLPYKCTNSYKTFLNETTQLEFLIIYILLAEHPEKENFNNSIINILKNDEINNVTTKTIERLQGNSGNFIFDSKNYEEYFGQMALARLTDNALCYFKDILAEVVKKNPNSLKSKDTITHEYVLSFDSMEDLIIDLSDKKIKALFYGSIEDIKKYFKDRLNINLFENEENEANFKRIIKERNLIVHNRGIINEELTKEFKIHENKIGKKLNYTYEELMLINISIHNIIVDIELSLSKKYNLFTSELN